MKTFAEWCKKKSECNMTEAENPFPAWDWKNRRMWELSQATVEELMAWKKKAEDTLVYLEKNHAIQRQNNLNPPKKQAEVERKNKAPHEQLIRDIEAELARRN